MVLYFDSNVYELIADRDEAAAVRHWVHHAGHILLASDEAVIPELLEVPNPEERARLIRTVFRAGAQWNREPEDLVVAQEMLAELRRLRPEWLKAYPDLRSRSDHLKHRKATVWDELRRDPWYLPPTMDHVQAAVYAVRGEHRDSQRLRREAVRAGQPVAFQGIPSRPDLTALMDTYPEEERYVRNLLMAHWRYLLLEPTTASAELDWLGPHLDVEAMAPATDGQWLDFWFREVDVARMPTSVLSILMEKQQHHHQIRPSNMIDRIHGAYLNLADRVVTCDVNLYKVMQQVVQRAQVRGEPVLLDKSGPSAVAQLRVAVG